LVETPTAVLRSRQPFFWHAVHTLDECSLTLRKDQAMTSGAALTILLALAFWH
jgi:hypothetical protein